jgi:hypothetical protein
MYTRTLATTGEGLQFSLSTYSLSTSLSMATTIKTA